MKLIEGSDIYQLADPSLNWKRLGLRSRSK